MGVKAREKGLKEIISLKNDYRTLKKGSQEIDKLLARRKKGFSLFSFMEKTAGKVNIKHNIKYMKPSVVQGTGPYKKSMVEMKLEEIILQQLVDYLYRIESSEKAISVKRCTIKENKEQPGSLDVVLQVLTFQHQ